MRLLIVSDSPCVPTGLGKTARGVGDQLLAMGHEVGYASYLHDGAPQKNFAQPIWPWLRNEIVPLDRAIKEYRPESVILLGDAWHFTFLPELRKSLEERSPRPPAMLLWLTVDSGPYPLRMWEAGILEAANYVACTTQFGSDVLNGMAKLPAPVKMAYRYAPATIQLGVDPLVYQPDGPPSRTQVRLGDRDRRLVIGWCGMNSPRKAPGAAIEMLAELRQQDVDAMLWMKTSSTAFLDLPSIAAYFGLTATMQSPQEDPGKDLYGFPELLTEEQMAAWYRRCDVFVSTASAGAPELPLLEAAACGTPTVAVDAGPFPEVASVLAAPKGRAWTDPDVVHVVPDPHTLACEVHAALRNPPPLKLPQSWNTVAQRVLVLLQSKRSDYLPGVVLAGRV